MSEICLYQRQMFELFQTTDETIKQYLKDARAEGDLTSSANLIDARQAAASRRTPSHFN